MPSGLQCESGACINPNCVPNCNGKACGSDGCGGSCGGCPTNYSCVNGECVSPNCQPNCSLPNGGTKNCGPDGCGNVCGTCASGSICNNGTCTSCTPNCKGLKCGPDGCGGSCGTCPTGQKCSNGSCASTCIPNCAGKTCGDDGCGGSCGTCTSTQKCINGACVGYYFIYGYSEPNFGGKEMFLSDQGKNGVVFITDPSQKSIFYYDGNLALVPSVGYVPSPTSPTWLSPKGFAGQCSGNNQILLGTTPAPFTISSSGDLSLTGFSTLIAGMVGSTSQGATSLIVKCPSYICHNSFGLTCLNVKMVQIQTN